MPAPRRLDPARRDAEHGFRVRAVLQQRRLQHRTAGLCGELQGLEPGSECDGEGAEVVCGRAGVCGVCRQWVCAAGTAERGVAGGTGSGGGEHGRGYVVGWARGDGEYAGGNGLFDDGEGSVGGVSDAGAGGWGARKGVMEDGGDDEVLTFVVYTHFLEMWLGEGGTEIRYQKYQKQCTSRTFPN